MKRFDFDNPFMEEALNQAQKASHEQEIPVGAVIVYKDQIVAKAHNLVEQRKNPLMHAELIAINAACSILGDKFLKECDIYVSLEPCTMCASAISQGRLRRLFYAAPDPKQGAVENGSRFFTTSSCFHRPEIYSGIGQQNSEQLIKQFFKGLRDK